MSSTDRITTLHCGQATERDELENLMKGRVLPLPPPAGIALGLPVARVDFEAELCSSLECVDNNKPQRSADLQMLVLRGAS